MKLKKIASLALAGLMAVSMLAGCGDNSSNGNGTVVEPGTSSSLVDALNKAEFDDEDVKITFTYSSELENDIKAALMNKAEGYVLTEGDLTAENGMASDTKFFGNSRDLPKADKETAMKVFIPVDSNRKMYNSSSCPNENVLLKVLVADVEKNGKTLPADTITARTAEGDTYYAYTYTGEVAMVSMKASSGVTTYYVVYTIEQTATQMEYKA